MRTVLKKSLLVIAVTGVIASPIANATNGLFGHGYSTKEKGVAGAGTAYSQDAMAAATNPAGMAFVGERMDIGAAIFSPSPRSYTLTGAGFPPPINGASGVEVESGKDFFLIPHFARNWMLDDSQTVGISIYGNGGMNSDYDKSDTPAGFGTFSGGDTGINLEQVFFNASFSKKLNKKDAVGASLIVAAQRVAVKGLSTFAGFSADGANISSNQHSTSFGVGLKVGYQGEFTDGVRVGVSYQSKIDMSEFDEYAGLLAEGGDLDVPSTFNIGISFDVGSNGMVIADLQRINYTDVAAISNSVNQLTNGSCNPLIAAGGSAAGPNAEGAGCLGAAAGAGFGWQDMTIIKIGYQFDVDGTTYRVGISDADQPIPEGEALFNVIAPAVIETHITAGMTMPLANNQEFNIAAMIAPSNSVKGPNPFDGGASQVEIEMSQWEIQAGYAWVY